MNNIIWALFKKEIKEFYRNPQTLVIFFVVVIMNLVLTSAIGDVLLEMTVNMSLVMLGMYSSAFLTMEEKEKNTLSALLLSPLNLWELIAGKFIFYITLTFGVTLGSVFLFHWKDIYVLQSIIGLFLGSILISFVGMGLGIICRKQADVSGWGTILFLSLFLPELIAPINPNADILAKMIPLHHIINFIRSPFEIEMMRYLIFLLLFVIISFLWTSSLFKRVILREGLYYKFVIKDLFYAIIILIIMGSSAYTFVEPVGRTSKINGIDYFVLPKREIQIPYNTEKYKVEEIKIFNRHVITFSPIDKKETSLNITFRKNSKSHSLSELMDERIEKLKEEKVFNLESNKLQIGGHSEGHQLEYETKKGRRWSYSFLYAKEKVTFSVSTKESQESSFYELKKMAIKLIEDKVIHNKKGL